MLTKDVILQQFPNVFNGLQNLGEEFDIKLTPDVQPLAMTTPCNSTLSLRPKVAQELVRMESMGVISRVDKSIPWCVNMVVVCSVLVGISLHVLCT